MDSSLHPVVNACLLELYYSPETYWSRFEIVSSFKCQVLETAAVIHLQILQFEL